CHAASSSFDRGSSAVAERMRVDAQLTAEVAGAENLDLLSGRRQAGLVKLLRIQRCAFFEAVQLREVDNGVDLLERVLEAAQLWQPLRQRHLAALEPDPEAFAAGQLAFLAPPGGFAVAGTSAPPDALPLTAGAVCPLQV